MCMLLPLRQPLTKGQRLNLYASPKCSQGKAWWAQEMGCGAIFDDRVDVCEAALDKGNIMVYPIRTRYEWHNWWRRDKIRRGPYNNLADALHEYIDNYLPYDVEL